LIGRLSGGIRLLLLYAVLLALAYAFPRTVLVQRISLLKYQTPRVTPSEWAVTMQNLGSALKDQGMHSNNSALLAAAVDTYREVLRSTSRDSEPLLWAATQRDLGLTLPTIGNRETGSEHLIEAVTAFRTFRETSIASCRCALPDCRSSRAVNAIASR